MTHDFGANEDDIRKRSHLLSESLPWIESVKSELTDVTNEWISKLDKQGGNLKISVTRKQNPYWRDMHSSDVISFINNLKDQFKNRADREIGAGAQYGEFVQELRKTVRQIVISSLRANNFPEDIINAAVRHMDGK